MSDEKTKRWLSTGCLRSAPTSTEDVGGISVIRGVSVCTVGEAKGHGVNLDSEFIADVVKFGNEKKQGLKARFGHPNMCGTALGTFLGRFKNFSKDGEQARADLFLSNEAKDSPDGDLHAYVLGMATNEPDMFGTSIVFTRGRTYKRTKAGKKIFDPGWSPDGDETATEHQDRREEWKTAPSILFVECEKLHACDTVDEPAANDGLFSQFSNHMLAGQLTEFLDLHPKVWEAMTGSEDVLKALGLHDEAIEQFITSYRTNRKQNQEPKMETKEKTQPESLSKETPEAKKPEATKLETKPAPTKTETKAEPEKPEKLETGKTKEAPEPKAINRDEFAKAVEEFGAEVTAKAFAAGGGYDEAREAHYAALTEENKALKKAANGGAGSDGVPHQENKEDGETFSDLFKSKKKK